MVEVLRLARSEFILGGQRSGKSRRAEMLARGWLLQSPDNQAVLIATAQPWDDEMRERITRHQQDRSDRVPGMRTVEEPLQLAQAITQHSTAQTLLVVDCLTLWLTNLMMPADNPKPNQAPALSTYAQTAMLVIATGTTLHQQFGVPQHLHESFEFLNRQRLAKQPALVVVAAVLG